MSWDFITRSDLSGSGNCQCVTNAIKQSRQTVLGFRRDEG